MMKLMKNKRGHVVPIIIIGLILFSIIALVFLLAYSQYIGVMGELNTALRGDGNEFVGSVNLTQTTDVTFGKYMEGLRNSANLIGIAVMFGMFIGLVVSAYFRRQESQLIFLFLDIFLIVISFIFATYISNSYEQNILTIPEVAENVVAYMPSASAFMLNLPTVVFIVGILILIVSHAGIPRKSEEEAFYSG